MATNVQFYFPCKYHYYYDILINLSHRDILCSLEYHGETMGDTIRSILKLREDKEEDRDIMTDKYLETINNLIPTFDHEIHGEKLETLYPHDMLLLSYPVGKEYQLSQYIFSLAQKIQSEASTNDEYYDYCPQTVEQLGAILIHLGYPEKQQELIQILNDYGHYEKPTR